MKSRSTRSKPKAKRKAAVPFDNGTPKRRTGFQPGNTAGVETRFKAGHQGGPGRPPGARNRLTEAFLEALGETWAKHGATALEWLATNDRALFVQVVASLVPRQVKAEIEETRAVYHISDQPLSDDEWAAKWCEPKEKPN